jgi:hypothetical protein
LEFLRV